MLILITFYALCSYCGLLFVGKVTTSWSSSNISSNSSSCSCSHVVPHTSHARTAAILVERSCHGTITSKQHRSTLIVECCCGVAKAVAESVSSKQQQRGNSSSGVQLQERKVGSLDHAVLAGLQMRTAVSRLLVVLALRVLLSTALPAI
eukprot:16373-Heterococcus_DN1.PRE.6